MKKIILIIGIIVVVGLIAWGVWFFMFSKNLSTNLTGSLPPVEGQAQNGTTASVQGVSSPQNPQVVSDFLGEIQNANQIALGGTVVVSPYALQIWGDANKGGEALLEYTSAGGWALVSLGGGEWTVLALIQEGVPWSVAEQLVAGLTNGTLPAASSTVSSPSGSTITIGTSQGSVAMNNFYKSPDYIAQDQQAVVIRQTATSTIIYNISDSSFWVGVNGTPFSDLRNAAEKYFLTTLGISEGDACKLNVTEGVIYSANNPDYGKSFPLSFCGQAF
jgi:hypothetical protein